MKFINPKAQAVAYKRKTALDSISHYSQVASSSTAVSAVGSAKAAGFLVIILAPWQLCVLT